MKSFYKKINKKVFIGAIGTAFMLFLGSTQLTYASVSTFFGIGDIASGVISGIAYDISYLLGVVAGILISIEAWFIGVVLNINANVLQTTLVQTGFSISLSVVNLAFVLGIIVIALATILRSQTYGIKQILWKLVVMAILVNFGLVIMSPIFALGNSFTQYFINCINPAAGGCTGNGSGVDSFMSFGQTFAGAFNPGTPFAAPSNLSKTDIANLKKSGFNGAFSVGAGGVGAELGQEAVPVFGILFVVIDLLLIVFILAGFIVLLTVRYIYIAILAILLPFAWASWVFPSFNSHWKRWWDLFIRWTFFAPIVLFFIYLALLTMKGGQGVFDPSLYAQSSNSLWSALGAFLSGLISPIIQAFLQEILLGGLIIGGMIAANSMGIKLAGTMVNVAEKGGKAAKNAAWNATKRRAGDRFRTMGKKTSKDGKETTTALQRFGSRLQGVPVPGFKTFGSVVAAKGSQAVFQEERAEDIKKFVTSELRGLDNKGLLARANSISMSKSNGTEIAAVAQELSKRDLIGSKEIASKMKSFIENSEKMGNIQSILSNRPELAAQTSAAEPKFDTSLGRMETATEAVARAISDATKKIKIADITDINYKSMGDPAGLAAITDAQKSVALAMSTQQLRKLVTEGNDSQSKAYKDTINRMMLAATTPGAPSLSTSVAATLAKLHTHVNSNPEWVVV